MAESIIQAGVQIHADVSGTQNINRLSQSISETSGETSVLTQQAAKLQQQWRETQANQALITHYRSLKATLADNRSEIKQTEQQMRQLDAQMQNGATQEQVKQYQKLQKQLAELKQEKRQLLTTLRETVTQMNQVGISSKNLADTQKQLATQARQAEQELQQLNQEAQKVQRIAQAKTVLGLDIDEQARAEIAQLDKAFADLQRSGTLSQTELARAAQLHAQKIREIETSLQGVKPSLVEIANEVSSVVGKAGGLAYAANEAMKFETAMAAVKKVTDGTPEQYEKLSGNLKELAAQLGIMPDQLAQIAAQGGQMGIAMDRLPEFTQMAAQMSVAFGVSADAAGELAAKTANVFGLQMDELERVGDAINTLGNTTAAKEAEISEVLLRIGGNSKQFGLTAQQAAALGAAFISLGKTPEVAGTAINAMLAKLQNAKNGTAEFKDALKDLGYSADEMAAQIAANPQAALDGFLAKLAQLDKQSRSEMLGQLFGTEYADDIALLTGSLKTYTDAVNTATDSEQTFGAMKRETEAALDTTAKKVEQAKVNLANAAIELGNALLPVIQAAASAVGGVAKTIGGISEQFPVLSQLAVLFMGAKVAVNAYQTAMRLSGQDSAASFLKTELSVKKLTASIISAGTAAKAMGGNIKAALSNDLNGINLKTNAIGGLKTALGGAAQSALALWGAWEMGKSIGTGLRESSEFVRDIGDNLGKTYAYIATLWDGNTFDDVNKYYRTTRQEMRETEEAAKKAKQAADEKAAADKKAAEEQAAQIRKLQNEREALNAHIQRNESSLKILSEAGLASGATFAMLSQQNEELRGKLAAVNAGLSSLNANLSEVSPFAKNKQALTELGLTAEQVSSGISQNAKTALDNFALAAEQFGTDADSMNRIFQAALQKMDSPEAIDKLKISLKSVGEQAGLSADAIRAIGDVAPPVADKVAQAFDKIGVDTQAVMGGVSAAAQQAMSDFQAALSTAKEQGVNDSRLIAAGFEQMMSKLKSPEEFAAFQKQLKDSGQTAQLTREQLERLNQAVEKGAIAATSAYDKLANSLKQASNVADIQAAGHAAEEAMKRGEISAEQYQEMLVHVRERTQEVEQKAQQSGDTTRKAHQQATSAAQAHADAEKQVGDAAQEAAKQKDAANEQAAKNEMQRLDSYGEAVHYTLGKMKAYQNMGSAAWLPTLQGVWRLHDNIRASITQLNDDMVHGGNLATSLARAEALALGNASKLDKTTLSNLQSAIDAARQKMQELGDAAKSAAQTAQKELLQLQGKTEQVAQMEQQQKIAELNAKLQEARAQGNRQAEADYGQAIAATQQAYQLKQQQEREAKAAEEREAREREQEQKAQQNTPPVNITLPDAPNIDLSAMDLSSLNVDTSALSDAIMQRDNQIATQLQTQLPNLVQQLAPKIMEEIMRQLQQQMKNQQ